MCTFQKSDLTIGILQICEKVPGKFTVASRAGNPGTIRGRGRFGGWANPRGRSGARGSEKSENPNFEKILHIFSRVFGDFGILPVSARLVLASLALIWETRDFVKIGEIREIGRKSAKMALPESARMPGLWGGQKSEKSGKVVKNGQKSVKIRPKTLTSEGQYSWFLEGRIQVFGGRKSAPGPKIRLPGAKIAKIRPQGPKNGQNRSKFAKNSKSYPNLF